MTNEMFVYILFAVGAIAVVAAAYISSSTPSLSSFGVGNIIIANRSWNVYIASTTAQQEEGYMYQHSTGNCNGDENCLGMLFPMDANEDICMWMHNTPIPLYQYWIYNGSIAYAYNGIPFSDYTVCHYGNAVLESQQQYAVGTKVELVGST